MKTQKIIAMLPLFAVQFFTWIGMFAMWIYATPVITKYIFRTVNAESPAFQEGTQWVGICFAVYSVLGATLTFWLHRILQTYPKYLVHDLCLLAGSIGLMSVYFVQSKYQVLLSFALIGIAWSSISTVPYLLVGELAGEDEPENYFSLFNFSTVIPQIVAAFLLAYLTKAFFAGNMAETIFAGGASMLVAAVISFVLMVTERTAK